MIRFGHPSVPGQVMKELQLPGKICFLISIKLYAGDILYFLRANGFAEALQGIESTVRRMDHVLQILHGDVAGAATDY